MTRRRDPVNDLRFELGGRHAGMRHDHHFSESCLTAGERCCHVAGEDRLERLMLSPFRVLGRHRFDAVEHEHALKVERLLRPERAVVVEGRDAIARRHVVLAARIGDGVHEIDDARLRLAVIPGREYRRLRGRRRAARHRRCRRTCGRSCRRRRPTG